MDGVKELSFKTAAIRALEWRVVSFLTDFTVVFLITRKIVFSLGITGTSNIVRTIVHMFWIKRRGHE